jgi:Holliday junction resolvase-like predicted endonuclease
VVAHSRRHTGETGEDAGVDYLEKKGYHILERNFRYERGEIDILARDGDELDSLRRFDSIAIEVHARHISSEPYQCSLTIQA